jgi:hypothetical protein
VGSRRAAEAKRYAACDREVEMKKFSLRIAVAFLTFAVGGVVSVLWQPLGELSRPQLMSRYETGRAKGARDVSVGRFRLLTYGEPIAGYNPYKEILSNGYNVEVHEGGCSVSDEILEEARGYNEVQGRELERRYGVGILNKVHQQSREAYEKYLKNNPRKR